MFKPFYVHCNSGTGKMPNRSPRGYTLYISADPDNNRLCRVQGALCSPKDQFNKKIGRETAMSSEIKIINKRDLPTLVGRLDQVVYPDYELDELVQDRLYLLKYVI